MSGQWRWAPRPDGSRAILGLDYAAAEAGLRLAGIDTTPALWAEIRSIERGAKDVLNGA